MKGIAIVTGIGSGKGGASATGSVRSTETGSGKGTASVTKVMIERGIVNGVVVAIAKEARIATDGGGAGEETPALAVAW